MQAYAYIPFEGREEPLLTVAANFHLFSSVSFQPVSLFTLNDFADAFVNSACQSILTKALRWAPFLCSLPTAAHLFDLYLESSLLRRTPKRAKLSSTCPLAGAAVRVAAGAAASKRRPEAEQCVRRLMAPFSASSSGNRPKLTEVVADADDRHKLNPLINFTVHASEEGPLEQAMVFTRQKRGKGGKRTPPL
ncbi:hypothetical protein TYRP_016868 [Tyrophagus putrescentiae]|nr:hypothetical protein TYRP_016868 [Tyrophagus putrescentiae]